MPHITARLPCSLHSARQHCSQNTAAEEGPGAEGRRCAKVAVLLAAGAHLSLGKHDCVQKSMFFKGITQVFLSEVLTEVLSMLRTGMPNGKCPHGGF